MVKRASDEERKGSEKSQEEVGIFTPVETPEDSGNMTNSEWMRRHSSNSGIKGNKESE